MMQRTWHCLRAPLLALALTVPGAAQADCMANWPLWEGYAGRFVQQDGRMLGSSMNPDQSSSEGQSYGMFFALVANDRKRFEQLWQWSRDNLAGGDTRRNLPGWLWGSDGKGAWTVLDHNSASDADLWMAYALLEADRLWHEPRYRTEALQMLDNVERTLVRDVPGLGRMLLPGPQGYEHPDQLWRFNASYLPLPLLRYFAQARPEGPWNDIANSTVDMLADPDINPYGFVPDWAAYRGDGQGNGRFGSDPFSNDIGSYDAIRVYLWAGMTPGDDRLTKRLLASLDGMAQATETLGTPPEKVHVLTRTFEGTGFYGFSAALVPLLQAKGLRAAAAQQQAIVEQALRDYANPASPSYHTHQYYHLMLSLFSLGWSEKRYQFTPNGSVQLSWEHQCANKP
ncbi:cellulose synthase complex periplasmic endoglucanase BcsZ [Pseudomonas kurunegalensis]|uniref:cellulose synthase complex periplasmic endoglucanase BcsZ n=1 Tax=Pseudomonas kurunegalensis TaxID=485880 RepID=UPI002570D9F2|nr:cellulose synthase complex periplasmic endoglucanase BcsZ [Pseudomonas kurunegalensis]WJD60333.1 cellulose synthase complex periplasmic endoglucanase BcsZ [Pseudomonas kurunegalensis]